MFLILLLTELSVVSTSISSEFTTKSGPEKAKIIIRITNCLVPLVCRPLKDIIIQTPEVRLVGFSSVHKMI